MELRASKPDRTGRAGTLRGVLPDLCGCVSIEGVAAKKAAAMRRTDASVEEFLAQVPYGQRRENARRLCAMMQEITGEPPALSGTSIVGFGTYHYRYASG